MKSMIFNSPVRLLAISVLLFVVIGHSILTEKGDAYWRLRQSTYGPSIRTGAHCAQPWKDSLAQFPHDFPPPAPAVYHSNAKAPCGLRYRYFIIHGANWHLTQRVVNFLRPELGGGKYIVMIDNSLTEDTTLAHNAKWLASHQIMVVRPRVPLGLGPGMEVIRRVAMELGIEFMLYSHNDANFTRSGLIAEAVQAVCRFQRERPTWGVLTFHFDVFCAYRTEAFRKTGMWDPFVLNYKADYDYYHRMRCAGFTFESYDKPDIGGAVQHLGSQTFRNVNKIKSTEYQFGLQLFDSFARFVYFWSKWNTNLEPWHPAANPFPRQFNGAEEMSQKISLHLVFCWLWINRKNELLLIIFLPWFLVLGVCFHWAFSKCLTAWKAKIASFSPSSQNTSQTLLPSVSSSATSTSSFPSSSRLVQALYYYVPIVFAALLFASFILGFKVMISTEMGGVCFPE